LGIEDWGLGSGFGLGLAEGVFEDQNGGTDAFPDVLDEIRGGGGHADDRAEDDLEVAIDGNFCCKWLRMTARWAFREFRGGSGELKMQ
jgi:hypothetical protein